jgi:hypothetical protein
MAKTKIDDLPRGTQEMADEEQKAAKGGKHKKKNRLEGDKHPGTALPVEGSAEAFGKPLLR